MRRGAHCGRIWSPWSCLRLRYLRSVPGASESSREEGRDGFGAPMFPNSETRAGSSLRLEVIMAKQNVVAITEKPKLKGKAYEKELRQLQAELCQLQEWVKQTGQRIIVVFEGRDGAGKGGTIKAITERVSPRVFRVVALPAPSDREKSQMYLQRYMQHFPAAGEIVIFDRSWYNRAGVEHVMGFVSKEEHQRFLELCPEAERYIVD